MHHSNSFFLFVLHYREKDSADRPTHVQTHGHLYGQTDITQGNTHGTGLFLDFRRTQGQAACPFYRRRGTRTGADTHTDKLRDNSRTALRRDTDKDRLTGTRTSSQGQKGRGRGQGRTEGQGQDHGRTVTHKGWF